MSELVDKFDISGKNLLDPDPISFLLAFLIRN